MKEFMKELWNNLFSLWKGLDGKGRTGLVAGVAIGGSLVVWLVFWTLHTDYQVLFADLDERDAAAIVEELKQRKVPYKLADSGAKLLVPGSLVHETRLGLMSKGVLLSGGVGFEIFDNKDLGMTEYTQKVNYQRALQGELARTIMAVDQVKLARVHLVVPEASIFKRDKTKPKASVNLVLKPGGRLNGEQIVGVQRLVAASVPGLDPPMVSVFDQRGVTLSAMTDIEDGAVGASAKLRLKRESEDYLTRKIAEVLDRTFGPGQAIVSVDVTLNFDEIKRTQHDIIPSHTGAGDDQGAVVRKRQVVSRLGPPMAVKTAETDALAAPASASGLNSTTEVEYEFGRRVEEVVARPGGIRRLSVGVLVPRHVGEEQLKKIRSIVSMAAGFNEKRGDAIAVHSVDHLLLANTEAAPPPVDGQAPVTDVAPPRVTGRESWVDDVLRRMQKDWMWIAAIALGAGGILLGAWGAFAVSGRRVRRMQESQRQLAEEQRQGLLADIRGWIEAEKNAGTGAVKG